MKRTSPSQESHTLDILCHPINKNQVSAELLKIFSEPGNFAYFHCGITIERDETKTTLPYTLTVYRDDDESPLIIAYAIDTNQRFRTLDGTTESQLMQLFQEIVDHNIIDIPIDPNSYETIPLLRKHILDKLRRINSKGHTYRIITQTPRTTPLPFSIISINPYEPGSPAHTLMSKLLDILPKALTSDIQTPCNEMLEAMLFHYFPCTPPNPQARININKKIKTAQDKGAELTTIPGFHIKTFVPSQLLQAPYLQKWLSAQEAILDAAVAEHATQQTPQATQTHTAEAINTVIAQADTQNAIDAAPQTPKLILTIDGKMPDAILALIVEKRNAINQILQLANQEHELAMTQALLQCELDDNYNLDTAEANANAKSQETQRWAKALFEQLTALEDKIIEEIDTTTTKYAAKRQPAPYATEQSNNTSPAPAPPNRVRIVDRHTLNNYVDGSIPQRHPSTQITQLLMNAGFERSTAGNHPKFTQTILGIPIAQPVSTHSGDTEFGAQMKQILNGRHTHPQSELERKVRICLVCKIALHLKLTLTEEGQKIYNQVNTLIEEEAAKLKTRAK